MGYAERARAAVQERGQAFLSAVQEALDRHGLVFGVNTYPRDGAPRRLLVPGALPAREAFRRDVARLEQEHVCLLVLSFDAGAEVGPLPESRDNAPSDPEMASQEAPTGAASPPASIDDPEEKSGKGRNIAIVNHREVVQISGLPPKEAMSEV